MSGGGTSTTTGTSNVTQNSSQTRAPWEGYGTSLQDILNSASNAYNSYDRSAYTGDTYAAPTAAQLKAAGLTEQTANQMLDAFGLNNFLATGELPGGGGGGGMYVGSPGYDETIQLGLDTLGGKYLSAESNPYLQSAIDLAQRRSNENFTSQVLPYVGSQAQLQGAYGGSRQGVQEALAQKSQQQTLADIASGMAYENYAAERQNQMNAPTALFTPAQQWKLNEAQNSRANAAAANAASNAALSRMLEPLNMLMGVGNTQQGWEQGQKSADLQQNLMNRELTSGLTGLGDWGSILNLMSGYGTTTGTSNSSGTTKQTAPARSDGANWLSGLLGVASSAVPLAGSLFTGGATAAPTLGALTSLPFYA